MTEERNPFDFDIDYDNNYNDNSICEYDTRTLIDADKRHSFRWAPYRNGDTLICEYCGKRIGWVRIDAIKPLDGFSHIPVTGSFAIVEEQVE